MLIMLDPGHGGKDPGAVRQNVYESHINESLTDLLAEDLAGMGHEIMLTRDLEMPRSDHVWPAERARRANRAEADCFISLHSNSFISEKPRGIRFYVGVDTKCQLRERLSESLAGALQTQAIARLAQYMPTGRIFRRKNLSVLSVTEMPAVIVETGFVSNPDDRQYLQNDDFLSRASAAYCIGIEKWLRRYEEVAPRLAKGVN